ncbi:MAG: hypothetical protein AB7N73_09660 [Gemmatimonadales bacterium]|nr:hypothetical protein [Gemmatimonadota bacterium]
MGRRHVKEFRPDEALSLISADREGKALSCPSCGSQTVDRTPPRLENGSPQGRVQLTCEACGRLVAYTDRAIGSLSSLH